MQLHMIGLYHIRCGCSNRPSLPMTYRFSCCIQISANSLSDFVSAEVVLWRGLVMIKMQIQRKHLSLKHGRNVTEKKTSSPMSTIQLSPEDVILWAKGSNIATTDLQEMFLATRPAYFTDQNLGNERPGILIQTCRIPIGLLRTDVFVCLAIMYTLFQTHTLARTNHICAILYKTKRLGPDWMLSSMLAQNFKWHRYLPVCHFMLPG